jgi:large subunit ribosomal protein L24
MKQKFSTKWVGSKQPRKQRKYLANAPLHTKTKLVSTQLSKALKEKYGKRNTPIRTGDKVKIMKGEFRNKTGKVLSVDRKNLRANIEGIFRAKNDGTKVEVWITTSNLQIQELNLDDKKRIAVLDRKSPDKKIKKLPTKPGVKNA